MGLRMTRELEGELRRKEFNSERWKFLPPLPRVCFPPTEYGTCNFRAEADNTQMLVFRWIVEEC
jgi:hypothetical protein